MSGLLLLIEEATKRPKPVSSRMLPGATTYLTQIIIQVDLSQAQTTLIEYWALELIMLYLYSTPQFTSNPSLDFLGLSA